MADESEDLKGSEIAIIGLACRFPEAPDVRTYWENLRLGRDCISRFSEQDLLASGVHPTSLARPNYVKVGGVVADAECFDSAFFGFSPRESQATDPQHRVFLECAWEALEGAGYDPDTFDGAIGVYAGMGIESYLWNVYRSRIMELVGQNRVLLGNSKDHLPMWASFKLNLRGPSVNVNTACSSSLVAVHLACQSLLNGECDMALAGGVTISAQQRTGYLYEEGGILARDGVCRAFDVAASGTVPGNGAGVVLLKRLADALQSGDSIRAVIRGSAINNDGATKLAYTAPSRDGQVRAIAEALAMAEVDPRTIGYVEAHGTGTLIGDVVEVAALRQAFAQMGGEGNGYCAIGSVKPAIGHTDTAAGVAGLIKTVLSLENGELPPSLHFVRENPEVDLAASPFYVNARLAPWPANGTPRRAGVSSFGIGGTNAHVVLEEAPPRGAASPSRPWQLLVVSARTATALERATDRLAGFLASPGPGPDLADVAYTLQAGRRGFARRRVLVCRDAEEAARLLASRDPQRVLSAPESIAGSRSTVFLFPGQGAQHVGMARELYGCEARLRERIDRGARLLEPELGLDLRRLLFPAPEDAAAAAVALDRTLFAQPALFLVEHALAELWMEWGIRPQAMIGHSIGEYTAACLAGVFSYEDGLRLVAARGRLMESLPEGRMVSVALPATELAGRLGPHLTLAAVNAPSFTVVSGPTAEVERLAGELSGEGVEVRPLRTSHAFHSAMMEPILDAFREEVGKVALKPPRIPYLSNLTGDWIAASEATDPDYWVRHLRQTVLFAAGLERLLTSPAALLEVGPGRSLGSLAKRVAQPMGRQPLVLSSLPAGGQDEPAQPLLLTTLGRLWLAGAPVDWAGFHRDERRLRVPLPTYPFERKRYFIEAQPRGLEERPAPLPAAPPETEEPADDAAASGIEALGRDVRPEHLAVGYQAPRTATERHIVALWEDLLGVERIGVHDGFFELGGHSLLLVQVIAGLRDLFHLSLPVADVAAAQTVAELATLVERRRALAEEEPGDADLAGELPVLVADPARRHEPFALTEVQEAYWIGRSGIFELGNVATHEYSEYQSDGVDIDRLAAAWRALIDRHEMLRAVILPDGRQQILAEVPPYEIVVDDLRGLPAEVVGARLGATRRRMSHQVLPADRWPLFELRASRLGERLYRLHVSLDLLILDAWSVQILTGELLTLYVAPETRLQPIEVSFRDYLAAEVAFRDSAAYRRSLDYWRGRLASLPPAPDLPLVQDPATLAQPHFSRRAGSLDAESWRRLKARAARVGITPSAVLMAAFGEVLAAWSKSPRLLINLTLFNRLPIHPHIDRVVGDFTSLVLLAVDATAPGSFEARAQRLQRQLWEDLEHRVVSGVRVLRELARGQGGDGQLALAPVVFTSTLSMRPSSAGERPPAGEEAGASGLGENVFGVSQTPQVWIDQAVGEHNGALVFGWDVVEDLFPAGMMEAMFEAYRELLGRLAADLGAWEAEVPDLLPRRFLDLYAAANATAAAVPEGLLHGDFLEWAQRAPARPAVIAAERTLSYGELLERARDLGHQLRALGARPNQLVAVVMEKGWEQVVAVLGILESGAAYLPIDAGLPRERVWHLLERGEVSVVVTQPWIAERLEWPAGLARLVVGAEAPAGPVAALSPVQGAGDLAYVIFTSGSTGTPKGVMIDHRGALNTIVDVNQRFSVGEGDRVLGLAALSFDLSVYDIFGPLAVGGAVVLPEPWAAREPGRWAEWLASSGVTVWDSVPVLMEMLVEHLEGRAEVPGALRLVMMSGDWIPVSLPDRIRRLWPGVSVVSLGGATEASIWSILYPIGEVAAEWKSIPYGRAMASQTFQVLDERLEPRPVWVPGDLYIGGVGLALGYWRDAERTAASFVVHPRTGERLYRTGDLGRWLPDGQIEFLGREDLQVKVQGHRIELGEIEAALVQHPAVRSGVVKAVGDRRGAKRLVAYVVPAAEPPMESIAAATAPEPLLDPIARLEFKTRQPGLRRDLTGPEVDLRGEEEDLGEDMVRSYALRRSFRKYLPQPLVKARLAGLLGSLRQIEWQGCPKYRYPSAGSLYPVQVYLQVKPDRVDELAGGLYYYDPARHRLLLVTADKATDGALFGSDNRAIYEAAGFALFLVVDYQAILPIYGERARDFALLEAGYMGQLLMAAAPESEIGLCPIGGLDFAPIARRLALHASHELVHSLLGGAIDLAEALAGGNEADDYDLFLRLLAEEAAPSPQPTVAQLQPSRPASVAGIAEQVRDFLRQRLPEHMIPSSFVLLTALPLSANGKVDRQALPEPEQGAATPAKTWVEPRDPLEAQIAELWRVALGVERLSVLDNFFELGGHSLAAARLVARVREVLSVDLPLAQLFQTPTVAAMAAAVAAQLRHPPAGPLPAVVLPAVVPDPESRYEPFPLTDLQHAYWIGRTGSFELGNLSPLYYAEIEMPDLSPARFVRALERLTLRHGMLRAAVLPDGRQQIRPPQPLEVPVADLSSLTPEGREAALAATRDELSGSFADPARDSLLAVRISRLDGRRHRVHMAVSLLICDAWSSGLLNRELRRLYGDPEAELPALELSFRDYVVAVAAARGSAVYERALDYWRHRLASLPGAPSLPLARNPATLSRPRFVRRQTSLDGKRWGRIKQRAARAGLTPDALLCTVYAEVLASWSKERRFLLTVLYFNRLPLHPQVDAVLGNFSSTLLLEVDLTAPASLPEQAAKLQAQLWKDIEHGLVSGVQVLRELARAQGLGPRAAAPVVFASTVGLGGGEPAPAGGYAEPEDLVLSRLQTPQVWLDHQVHEANGALLASWDAVEDLFPPGLVDDMFAAYAGLLERLGDEDVSAWQESFHPLLPEPQRARRLAANATWGPVPAGLLDDGLGEQAARQPDHPAVVWRSGMIRYGELDRLATAIGRRLETLGAGPERIVAVVMEKGWEQVAAVYGVLRSGAAYLPVDPGLPRERIEYLLATCEVDLVLSQPWVSAAFSWPEGVRCLDVDAGFRAATTDRMLSRERSPEHLAYVIFTSGSTGQPKGVMIEHRAALNTIVDINSRFTVGARDRVLALAALSFDLSVYDIFGALTAGGTVVMAEPEIGREPGLLADWLEQAGVTIWDSVPAQMEMLADRLEAQGALLPASLRLVMMSGDWIPVGLPDRIKALRPGIEVISLGGATEASIWSILHPITAVDRSRPSIPYGRPMVNQTFHVLDERLEPSPEWTPGALYIGGIGLARGYYGDSERTAASFFVHPRTGERLYRTGDMGRFLPDGEIEFLGREDLQVKVQGYRIELGEIEAALTRHPAVRAAVATAVGERQGSKRLIAYVVAAQPDGPPSAEELRTFLQSILPSYMVPASYVVLEAIPLSANGKVDRAALGRLGAAEAKRAAAEKIEPRDEMELGLVRIWEEVLGRPAIGVTNDFFDLGGDSVLAVRLMGRIQRDFGRDLPLATLFENGTIERQAALLRGEDQGRARSPLVKIQPEGEGLPFFCVHPVGGNVLCYLELARALGTERPFFGLQAPEPAASDAADLSVETLAALYLRELRAVQPAGPYLLGGWSMGAVVAFEMARQLPAGEVGLLAMIDVAPPNSEPLPEMPDEGALAAWFARDLASLAARPAPVRAEELRGLDAAERMEMLTLRCQQAKVLPEGFGAAELAQLFALFARNYRALLGYVPQLWDGHALLFQAMEGEDAEREAGSGWRRLTRACHQEDVPGNHYTALREPLVRVLGERLAAALAAASAEARRGVALAGTPDLQDH